MADFTIRPATSSDGAFLYYSNDVPEIWRRTLRPSASKAQTAGNAANGSNVPDTLVMALPLDPRGGGSL